MDDFFFFFGSRTVYFQDFQLETNHCSCQVGPQRGKVLAQENFFKVQVTGLKLENTPNRAQYKHLEIESPTNSTNPLGLDDTYLRSNDQNHKCLISFHFYY